MINQVFVVGKPPGRLYGYGKSCRRETNHCIINHDQQFFFLSTTRGGIIRKTIKIGAKKTFGKPNTCYKGLT